MDGSLRIGRRGATSKIRFDHVGEDDARLGEVEACDGRIHLVDPLATAQKLGIDRTDLVEHLLQLAIIAEELGDLDVAQTQSLDARNSSDLQDNKAMTAKWMKGMGNFSRS